MKLTSWEGQWNFSGWNNIITLVCMWLATRWTWFEIDFPSRLGLCQCTGSRLVASRVFEPGYVGVQRNKRSDRLAGIAAISKGYTGSCWEKSRRYWTSRQVKGRTSRHVNQYRCIGGVNYRWRWLSSETRYIPGLQEDSSVNSELLQLVAIVDVHTV